MNMLKLFARMGVTLIVVAAAVLVGRHLWTYYMEEPWTQDARVRADIVNIAPDVSGLVTDVMVKDNQTVQKGQVLFRVDRKRFELALAEAEASLQEKKSAWDEAILERQRQEKLGASGSAEAKEKAAAAEVQAKAAYDNAKAARDTAALDLDRSDVTATVNGTVTNLELKPGDFVSRGTAKIALVDSDSLRIEAYFEENKLTRIHKGDKATILLMNDPTPLAGHVDSIAAGIQDSERSSSSGLLPNINPTFNWVRLAQRVPVRIHLDAPPASLRLIAGTSATVSIGASLK
ncbi:HlyD family secretion protein [Allorhizobium sp. BGMRC 0089]|uniref:efflux RND transporter periplasmic adaptor subunit n=1 Tax=Allorhizobium sonneratiae TaxID=2934936 RepID=UPI002033E16C|nr:HlyD family secretion protein [Allorhizobium sonneratiae]MCM2290947.1 HlyD family secretion protein [Allorhizobium sonneratiae]